MEAVPTAMTAESLCSLTPSKTYAVAAIGMLISLPVVGVRETPVTVKLYDRIDVPGGGTSGMALMVTPSVASLLMQVPTQQV